MMKELIHKKKENIKVGIYGLEGSYTHQAAMSFFKNKKEINVKFVHFKFFLQLFNFAESNNFIFFPIENSTAGTVDSALVSLYQRKIKILAEKYFLINHTLLTKKNIKFSEIKNVYSHPQALNQCSNFLEKNNFNLIPFSDTAAAAEKIATSKEKNSAIIGSDILSNIHNLNIIKRKFQNDKNNTTRFFLATGSKKINVLEKFIKNNKKKTAIIFETKNISGVLYKCLGAFATNDINLLKIESCPMKNKSFDFFFFIEFEGSIEDERVQKALKELTFFAKKITTFGSY